jgi:hypothetical protein
MYRRVSPTLCRVRYAGSGDHLAPLGPRVGALNLAGGETANGFWRFLPTSIQKRFNFWGPLCDWNWGLNFTGCNTAGMVALVRLHVYWRCMQWQSKWQVGLFCFRVLGAGLAWPNSRGGQAAVVFVPFWFNHTTNALQDGQKYLAENQKRRQQRAAMMTCRSRPGIMKPIVN